jgi:hypothetical protein
MILELVWLNKKIRKKSKNHQTDSSELLAQTIYSNVFFENPSSCE